MKTETATNEFDFINHLSANFAGQSTQDYINKRNEALEKLNKLEK